MFLITVIDLINTPERKFEGKKCVNSLSLLQTSRAHIRIRNQPQLKFMKHCHIPQKHRHLHFLKFRP